MMPVSELVSVAESLDSRGTSELALRAAEAWGYRDARFVRSSANHVFACRDDDRPTGVLRLRPLAIGSVDAALQVAEHALRLAAAGCAVAPAIRALDGALFVVVDRDAQAYVATMSAAVLGDELDGESLTATGARAWGRGLARLHELGSQLSPSPPLPSWPDLVETASERLAKPSLNAAATAVAQAVRMLPCARTNYGVVHGDPELDNVVWRDAQDPCFVDLDDASHSWFGADICFALRELTTSRATDAHGQLVDAFVSGYGEVRIVSEQELAWMPLFGRAHAVVTLARLEPVLLEPALPQWPHWAHRLQERIRKRASELEALILLDR